MSETSIKKYDNPFAIPEPHFPPGYTGHCPMYQYSVGESYGKATYNAIEMNPDVGGRLKEIPVSTPSTQGHPDGSDDDEEEEEEVDEDLNLVRNRQINGVPVLTENIMPGYTGHIPRTHFVVGLNYNRTIVKGIAEFEKLQQIHREYEVRDPCECSRAD